MQERSRHHDPSRNGAIQSEKKKFFSQTAVKCSKTAIENGFPGNTRELWAAGGDKQSERSSVCRGMGRLGFMSRHRYVCIKERPPPPDRFFVQLILLLLCIIILPIVLDLYQFICLLVPIRREQLRVAFCSISSLLS